MTQPAMDGFEAARYQLGHPSCLTSVARRPGVAAARVAEVDGEGGCVEVHVGSHPSVVFILSLEDRLIQEINLLGGLRAERAKGLLHASSLPIGDVAAAVGYETHQAFSRMFVDVVGVTPSQYRSARAARGAASPASPEPTAAPGPGEDQEVP